jgi:hypothetical protein
VAPVNIPRFQWVSALQYHFLYTFETVPAKIFTNLMCLSRGLLIGFHIAGDSQFAHLCRVKVRGRRAFAVS